MNPAFNLASPETGTEYRIYAEAPGATSPGPWPVVLFLDADDQFPIGVAAYRKQLAAGRVPPLLLVGVGYGASYAKPANKRGRDYTPVAHPDEPASGGAAPFRNFLTGTLWAELRHRYPVRRDARGIAGHSLSSLLVLDALFQPQPFFTHYLASAPSIWWANQAMLEEAALLRRRQAVLAARLFLCVGEDDTASMTGDLAQLERQLAAEPFTGLEITSRRFSNRNHYNVLPDAFGAGLVYLFGV